MSSPTTGYNYLKSMLTPDDAPNVDGTTIQGSGIPGDPLRVVGGAGGLVTTADPLVGDGSPGAPVTLPSDADVTINTLTAVGIHTTASATIDTSVTAQLFSVVSGGQGFEALAIANAHLDLDATAPTQPTIRASSTGAQPLAQLGSASATPAVGPQVSLRRARGSVGAPTVVASLDLLASFLFSGYDGDEYAPAARMDVTVLGAPGNNDMPGKITFLVTPDGSKVPTSVLRLASAVVTVDTPLTVAGVAALNGTFTQTASIPAAIGTDQTNYSPLNLSVAGFVIQQVTVGDVNIFSWDTTQWTSGMTKHVINDPASGGNLVLTASGVVATLEPGQGAILVNFSNNFFMTGTTGVVTP